MCLLDPLKDELQVDFGSRSVRVGNGSAVSVVDQSGVLKNCLKTAIYRSDDPVDALADTSGPGTAPLLIQSAIHVMSPLSSLQGSVS